MGKHNLRILIYQLGSIGDTVVSIPALKAVRRHYGSNAEITLLHEIRQEIKTTPADLLRGGSEVDCYIGYTVATNPWGKLISAIRLLCRLQFNRFHAVVYLLPSERTDRQVRRDMHFFRYCGITKHIGFHSFPYEFLYPIDSDGHPGKVMHEALCRLERLRLDGIDISKEADLSQPFLRIPQCDLSNALVWLDLNRYFPTRPLVAICPGSKQPANAWPAERFVEIGKRLVDKNKYELIVIGGRAEAETGTQMIKAWGKGLNAAGQLSVLESAALLGQCAFSIGVDTGTTHLASAFGTPCVVLFGEHNNEGRFAPLGLGHIVLRNRVPCAGCRLFDRHCTTAEHPCMMGISVETVWQAVLQMEENLAKKT